MVRVRILDEDKEDVANVNEDEQHDLCMHARMCICIHACVCVCVRACVRACVCVCQSVRACVCMKMSCATMALTDRDSMLRCSVSRQ